MHTYRQYIDSKLQLEDEMKDTRVKEGKVVQELDETRRQLNSELFDKFLEQKHANNLEYSEKIRMAREGFKAERRRIHEKITILSAQWKGNLTKLENGEITMEDIYGSEDIANQTKEVPSV